MKQIKEKKYTPQERYDKKNTKNFTMKLNLKTDSDIFEWLDKQSSKQGAIKELIRKEIKK
ncbi:hypothetical protein ACGCUP_07185 [Eubacteriales bacterium KG125]